MTNDSEQGALSANDFVGAMLSIYGGLPENEVLSIGTWEVIETNLERLTLHTMPRFHAGMRITIGQLKAMKQ